MFEFLFSIIRWSHHTQEVQQLINVYIDDFESSRKRINECKQLFFHIVHHDQDQLIHDDSAKIEDESIEIESKKTHQSRQWKQQFKSRSQ